MRRRFQFGLMTLFAVTTSAAIATWFATLGGSNSVAAFPVIVAVLWGIYRRDGIFLCGLLLVVTIWSIFLLAAQMQR